MTRDPGKAPTSRIPSSLYNDPWVKVPITALTDPKFIGMCIIKPPAWWQTDGTNLFFYKDFTSPQCHQWRHMLGLLPKVPGFKDSIHLERVFVPMNLKDYMD